MTYGMFKMRVFALLNLEGDDDGAERLLRDALRSVARKTAESLKCCMKEAELTFVKEGDGFAAALPSDLLSVKSLFVGGRLYPLEQTERAGNRLFLSAKGIKKGRLTYYADPMGDDLTADTALPFDGATVDTLAYGTAAELCQTLCPADTRLYRILAAEYDARLQSGASRGGDKHIANTLFGRRGGRL